MSDEISRRTVLRNGSAGALSIGIAGLAGCTSSIPFIGGDDEMELDAWLFSPSLSDVLDDEDVEIEEVKEDQKGFDAVVPEAIYDNEDELNSHRKLTYGSDIRGRAGVAAVDCDWSLEQSIEWSYETESSSYSRTADVDVEIVAGDFDTGSVEDNLEKWVDDEYNSSGSGADEDETELEDAGSEPGFELYEIEDQNQAFGVSEDHLIQAETSMDAVAVVEAAIDAYENETGRWTRNDHGDELLSNLDTDDYVSGQRIRPITVERFLEDQYDDPDEADEEQREEIEEQIDDWMAGLVGQAESFDIDGDETDLQQVYLYENESDADSDALREYIEANRDYNEEWDTLEDYSIDQEGRALILTGTVRTQTV